MYIIGLALGKMGQKQFWRVGQIWVHFWKPLSTHLQVGTRVEIYKSKIRMIFMLSKCFSKVIFCIKALIYDSYHFKILIIDSPGQVYFNVLSL